MVCGSAVVAEALKEVGPNSVGALGDERVVGEVVLAVDLIEERDNAMMLPKGMQL